MESDLSDVLTLTIFNLLFNITLQKAAANNGLYHLKAVAYKSNEEQTKMATSFIKAVNFLLLLISLIAIGFNNFI